jgi:hypothetical protein
MGFVEINSDSFLHILGHVKKFIKYWEKRGLIPYRPLSFYELFTAFKSKAFCIIGIHVLPASSMFESFTIKISITTFTTFLIVLHNCNKHE